MAAKKSDTTPEVASPPAKRSTKARALGLSKEEALNPAEPARIAPSLQVPSTHRVRAHVELMKEQGGRRIVAEVSRDGARAMDVLLQYEYGLSQKEVVEKALIREASRVLKGGK